MEVKNIKTKDLKPYSNNPRRNAKAINSVKESILKFGFKVPIVIDKNNVIVCGHTRWLASKSIGLETVPCVIADDLTQEQIDAFRLVDNRTAEFSEWDFEKLAEELSELSEFDLSAFGFDELMAGLDDAFLENAGSEVKEDNYTEPLPENPTTKLGDLWKLGNHYLLCGDATKSENYEKLLKEVRPDLIFTDPPYGVNYANKNKVLNKLDGGNRLEKNIIKDDATDADLELLLFLTLKNLSEYTSNNACYYITFACLNNSLYLLQNALLETGFLLKHMLIWNKNNHVLSFCDYNYKHEPILYGWKKKGTHNFIGKGEFKSTVWDIDKPQASKEHPTMKPLKLIENCILDTTNENENVIDVFGGSGSTLMACEQLNRNCYTMELDPAYCDVIINRWQLFTGKVAEKIKG